MDGKVVLFATISLIVLRQSLAVAPPFQIEDYRGVILRGCEKNDPSSINDLLDLYLKAESCFGTKMLYSISQEAYLVHVRRCTSDLVRKMESCLSISDKYLPGFLLKYGEELVKLLYRNIYAIPFLVPHCTATLNRPGVRNNCTYNFQATILPKNELCRILINSSECYTESVKKHCHQLMFPFAEDYLKAAQNSCFDAGK